MLSELRARDRGALPAESPAVGRAGFPALLMARHLISRNDLAVAQQHAISHKIGLAEAFVALGLVPETECYAVLAEAAGLDVVDPASTASSELAVRLVPERLARRHIVVPLSVDNRTLTYATCGPFDPEIERDLAFASGRRMQPIIAPRSGVLEDCPLRLAAIKDAVDRDDAEQIRQTAHALKGAAGNLSAAALFGAARALERIGSEGRLEAARAVWRRLSTEAAMAMDALRQFQVPSQEAVSCAP